MIYANNVMLIYIVKEKMYISDLIFIDFIYISNVYKLRKKFIIIKSADNNRKC